MTIIKSRLLLAAVCVCILAFALPFAPKLFRNAKRHFSILQAMAQVATPTPFTLVAKEYHSGSGLPKTFVAYRIAARSSDGSRVYVSENYSHGGAFTERSREIYMADGRFARVSDHLKMKSSIVRTGDSARWTFVSQLAPSTDCTNDYVNSSPAPGSALRHETISAPGGPISVTVVDAFPTQHPGKYLYYRAPSLGCFEVQYHVDFGDSYDFTEFTSVGYGDPDPALFAIGSDYQEAKPGDVALAQFNYQYKLAGKPPGQYKRESIYDLLDRKYSEHTHW